LVGPCSDFTRPLGPILYRSVIGERTRIGFPPCGVIRSFDSVCGVRDIAPSRASGFPVRRSIATMKVVGAVRGFFTVRAKIWRHSRSHFSSSTMLNRDHHEHLGRLADTDEWSRPWAHRRILSPNFITPPIRMMASRLNLYSRNPWS